MCVVRIHELGAFQALDATGPSTWDRTDSWLSVVCLSVCVGRGLT